MRGRLGLMAILLLAAAACDGGSGDSNATEVDGDGAIEQDFRNWRVVVDDYAVSDGKAVVTLTTTNISDDDITWPPGYDVVVRVNLDDGTIVSDSDESSQACPEEDETLKDTGAPGLQPGASMSGTMCVLYDPALTPTALVVEEISSFEDEIRIDL